MGFATPSGDRGFGRDIQAALERFGLLPELVNRLTGIIRFPPPTVEQLVAIARAPTGVITSYVRLLKPGGVDLVVTEAAVLLMAEHSCSRRTYARGLKAIMGKLVENAVFTQTRGKITYGVTEVRAALAGMGDE